MMAREIKFRAWLGGQNRYVGVDAIDFDEDSIRINDEYFFLADLEQYTGLTDKNGTEIYEGDILGYVDDSLKLGVVKYESHGFIIDWGKDCHMSKHILNLSDRFDVIGNIYENPELLEGK